MKKEDFIKAYDNYSHYLDELDRIEKPFVIKLANEIIENGLYVRKQTRFHDGCNASVLNTFFHITEIVPYCVETGSRAYRFKVKTVADKFNFAGNFDFYGHYNDKYYHEDINIDYVYLSPSCGNITGDVWDSVDETYKPICKESYEHYKKISNKNREKSIKENERNKSKEEADYQRYLELKSKFGFTE